MNLIITSSAQLRAAYGQAGERRVLAAIARLITARAARGVATRLALIEDGMADLGIAGAANDPSAIAGQIALVAQALERAGDRLESLLIVGGPEIMPFHMAANPIFYDGDEAVPSDCLYAARNPFALLPEWPVGRIPSAAGDDPDLLLRLLEHAASARPADQLRKSFGYCTAGWRRSSAEVYAEIDAPERLLVSPPVVAATLDRRAARRGAAAVLQPARRDRWGALVWPAKREPAAAGAAPSRSGRAGSARRRNDQRGLLWRSDRRA